MDVVMKSKLLEAMDIATPISMLFDRSSGAPR